MKPSICVLTLIFAVLAIAEGNHNAGKKFKTRQNDFNPVQPVITVYKIAEESDIPADFARRPDKYEIIQIGVLQSNTSNVNARNGGLCIIGPRRKRSVYVHKDFIDHEEENTPGSRKGKAGSYNGSNIKIKQPFIFRGYLSKENAAAIEQQFKPANAHTYFRAGNPNTEHHKGGQPLRWWKPSPPPPPPPTFTSYPSTTSTSFPSSFGSYPWTSPSFPFPSPGLQAGPIVVSGPGPVVQANYQNKHCLIVTPKTLDLNAVSINGETLRLRRRSN